MRKVFTETFHRENFSVQFQLVQNQLNTLEEELYWNPEKSRSIKRSIRYLKAKAKEHGIVVEEETAQ